MHIFPNINNSNKRMMVLSKLRAHKMHFIGNHNRIQLGTTKLILYFIAPWEALYVYSSNRRALRKKSAQLFGGINCWFEFESIDKLAYFGCFYRIRVLNWRIEWDHYHCRWEFVRGFNENPAVLLKISIKNCITMLKLKTLFHCTFDLSMGFHLPVR